MEVARQCCRRPRHCEMRIIATQKMFGLTIPRFQLAFGHAGVHSLDKMKAQLVMMAVALLIGACNRQAPAPTAAKTDLDRFQGPDLSCSDAILWKHVAGTTKKREEDDHLSSKVILSEFPGSAAGRHEQVGDDQAKTKRKRQRRWTPSRPRKKSCSASPTASNRNRYKVRLRPFGSAASDRYEFRPWEWLHPPGLGTGEEKLSRNGPSFSDCILQA